MMKLCYSICRLVLVSGTLALGCAVLRGQTIIQNFSGVTLNDIDALPAGSGGTPPDTMGAAGPNQFVEFSPGPAETAHGDHHRRCPWRS